MSITFKELQIAVARPHAKEQMKEISKQNDGRGLFHEFLEEIESPELYEKISFLFAKAKELELDINQVWFHQSRAKTPFAKWGNTPLHNGLAYENFQVLEWFLELAHQNQMAINLQAQDACGKTPLMLAIKVNAPFDLMKKLVTDENYHMADKDGMTPMMLACALRRIDVMKFLIEQDAKLRGYGPIDFTEISAEQKVQMAAFINQVHEESGKSLGHFSVLRAGTISDQKGENLPQGDVKKVCLAKQGCVINLLKDAGMDGFRDENARWNCVTNEMREPFSVKGELMRGGQLCFVSNHAERDDGGQVYLNTKENIDNTLMKYGMHLERQAPNLYQHLRSQKLSGISLIESIMARSESSLALLKTCGLNLEIKQISGDKTISGFIEGLKENVARENLISPLDVKYLFGLLSQPQEKPIRLQSLGMFHEVEAEASCSAVVFKAAV